MAIKYKWVCEYCGAEVITYGTRTPNANGCQAIKQIVCGEYVDGLHKWCGEPVEEDDE